jgi:diguanylate cyclase (GGDEF)-like protein
MTLIRRIALMLAGILLLALGGSLAIHTVAARQALQAQLELRNRDAALAMASVLAQQHNDPMLMQAAAMAQMAGGSYRLIDIQPGGGAPAIRVQQPAADGRVPAWFSAALPIDAAPGQAPLGDAGPDGGVVRVTSQVAWAREALWDACVQTTALLAALMALTAILAAWALQAWLGPLQSTIEQAQALEQGRFVEAEEPSLPELRGLARSMNATVRRLRDVFSAQAEQVALLQRQAQLDAVTGLPTRQHFLSQLQRRLAQPGGPGLAVLLVRVVNLDALNPRIGHEATDRLLRGIADVLLTYVDRVVGTYAGRLNGSDFALCLPVAGVAQETAESLMAALNAGPAMRVGGADVVVGGVDGVRDTNSSTVLSVADAALARAESDEARLAIEMLGQADAEAAGSRAWREQIAAALAEGRVQLSEFEVLNARGELIHFQCPLRVQLRDGGAYQAAQHWLALAHRSRLMPQVDLAALELALAAIIQDGFPRAVHASLVSIQSPAFVAEVAARLRAAPEAARRLSIECAEGPWPTALAPLTAAALAWCPLGVRLGVEHAGATPQQLPGLHDAGIAYVKVDARHLRGVSGNEAVYGYAQSLVALIHGLGLTALAEGIDDERDLGALWALGFDGATGPAVHEEVEAAPVTVS